MLFGYPMAATAENWLHDCLVNAVQEIHRRVDGGVPLPRWPEIIPLEFRKVLQRRHGLRDRFSDYGRAIRGLNEAERNIVLEALVSQNRIGTLLSCQSDCATVEGLPKAVHEPVEKLFTFGFELLSEFDIRQRQYEIVCQHIPNRVCPFCGCESLDAPGAPQEDLDHYIPRSKYPFAAANLRNLAPMGGRCNKAYKKAQDLLRRDTGVRRRAPDPYEIASTFVSLDNSVVDELTPGPLIAEWVIDFVEEDEAVQTWDEVFHIRERWTRDILDEKTFKQWIDDFRRYCKVAALRFATDRDVVNAVRLYQEYVSGYGYRDKGFLKAAVFRFLLCRATLGCSRLLPILRDAAGCPQP